MPRKTAAERAAEEAAAALEERRRAEQRRLAWVGAAIVALALFAGGYATGRGARAPEPPVAPLDRVVPPTAAPDFGGMHPPLAAHPGHHFHHGDGPHQRGRQAPLQCEPVERDGRTITLVCEFTGDRMPGGLFPDDAVPPPDAGGFLGVAIEQTPRGVLVTEVLDESPAAGAGIEPGDVIAGFAGVGVESARQLAELVGDTPPGTEVEVVLLRSGSEVTVTVIVGAFIPD